MKIALTQLYKCAMNAYHNQVSGMIMLLLVLLNFCLSLFTFTLNRLQEHTLAQQAPLPKEPRHPWPPPPTTTTLDEHHHSSPGAAHDSHMTHPGVDSNVARWIEERDILLQTGVYSSNDPTIQKLDLKIRQALAQQPSTSEGKQ